ncbi:MAG: hypothetical protein ACTHZ7_09310 [Sphingobacterium sp.]
METTLIRKTIFIQTELCNLQEILTSHGHIKNWDKGFDLFREIHVEDQGYKIIHWDIEHDLDYVFDLLISDGSIILELTAKKRSESPCSVNCNRTTYVKTILERIKEYSEGLQDRLIPMPWEATSFSW